MFFRRAEDRRIFGGTRSSNQQLYRYEKLGRMCSTNNKIIRGPSAMLKTVAAIADNQSTVPTIDKCSDLDGLV